MEEALAAYRQSAAAGPAADPFRIASLARLAEIAEERGDNRTAAIALAAHRRRRRQARVDPDGPGAHRHPASRVGMAGG